MTAVRVAVCALILAIASLPAQAEDCEAVIGKAGIDFTVDRDPAKQLQARPSGR